MLNRLLFSCCFACAVSLASALRAQTRTSVDPHALSLSAIGDGILQILSPSLLELTQISTKEKAPPWVQLQTLLGGGSDAAAPPAAPAFEVTSGGRAVKIAAIGMKRRVSYAPVARRDLRVATRYYLRLAEPLWSGAYNVTTELIAVNQARGLRAAAGATGGN